MGVSDVELPVASFLLFILAHKSQLMLVMGAAVKTPPLEPLLMPVMVKISLLEG